MADFGGRSTLRYSTTYGGGGGGGGRSGRSRKDILRCEEDSFWWNMKLADVEIKQRQEMFRKGASWCAVSVNVLIFTVMITIVVVAALAPSTESITVAGPAIRLWTPTPGVPINTNNLPAVSVPAYPNSNRRVIQTGYDNYGNPVFQDVGDAFQDGQQQQQQQGVGRGLYDASNGGINNNVVPNNLMQVPSSSSPQQLESFGGIASKQQMAYTAASPTTTRASSAVFSASVGEIELSCTRLSPGSCSDSWAMIPSDRPDIVPQPHYGLNLKYKNCGAQCIGSGTSWRGQCVCTRMPGLY